MRGESGGSSSQEEVRFRSIPDERGRAVKETFPVVD